MKLVFRKIKLLVITSMLFGVVVFSGSASSASANDSRGKASEVVTLDIYKSRTCGCCEKWVNHMEDSGFQSRIHHPADLSQVKKENNIPSGYQACHTAVSENGYVFEGHIPAHIVKQFLSNPPENSMGLTVPGMPLGSPGMEMDKRFIPHDVFLLKRDGTTEVYVHIKEASS